MKKLFIVLTIFGIFIISILSFKLPKEPYQTIPALTYRSFDKPLWSCYLICGVFIYTLLLWILYDLIQTKKNKNF